MFLSIGALSLCRAMTAMTYMDTIQFCLLPKLEDHQKDGLSPTLHASDITQLDLFLWDKLRTLFTRPL
jgi:hypothetical protein